MTYWRLWFAADGTHEYGQGIRWIYLMGELGMDPKASEKMKKLDNRNFKKWSKLNDNKSFQEYLKVAMV